MFELKNDFVWKFNQALIPGTFPQSLTKLSFGYCFNQPLRKGVLPTQLQCLVFGFQFDQPLPTLPSTLTILDFGYGFARNICSLPEGIRTLKLGDFCEPSPTQVSLPKSLTELRLPHYFNEVLSANWLPSNLTSLSFFDGSFDQPLNVGVLPSGLTKLSFGQMSDFDQAFGLGALPSSLERLSLGSGYTQALPVGVLPASLTQLKAPMYSGSEMILPVGLLKLYFYELPFHVTPHQFVLDVLPTSLTDLDLGHFDHKLEGQFPPRLKILQLHTSYNTDLLEDIVLPSSLEYLFVGEDNILSTDGVESPKEDMMKEKVEAN